MSKYPEFTCQQCGAELELQRNTTIGELFTINKGIVNYGENLIEDQPGGFYEEKHIVCSKDSDHNTGYILSQDEKTIKKEK